MKKQLNTTAVINELRGASVFFKSEPAPDATPPSGNVGLVENAETKVGETKPTEHPTSHSISRPVSQSTDQSTAWSIDRTTILGRPKAFYITEKQDKDLDVAVEKLAEMVKGKVYQKIDRSMVIRLLLEANDLTTNELSDKLASQLIGRLISQLTE